MSVCVYIYILLINLMIVLSTDFFIHANIYYII